MPKVAAIGIEPLKNSRIFEQPDQTFAFLNEGHAKIVENSEGIAIMPHRKWEKLRIVIRFPRRLLDGREKNQMEFETVAHWSNENQGIIALAGILLGFPALAVIGYSLFRKIRPSRGLRRSALKKEIAHAEALKSEVETRAEWSEFGFYGDMQIRDVERALPDSEENHSTEKSPFSIVTLVGIHNEHLAFLTDCRGVKTIKNIAGYWHYADESDEEAITVETVVWINYRDIECFRWETNWYWEWPQVCCRFADQRSFPVSNVLYVQRVKGQHGHSFRTICLTKNVTEMPSVFV